MKRKLCTHFFLFLIVYTGVLFSESPALRAIFACDTTSDLGYSLEHDLSLMNRLFENIAKELQLSYDPIIIKGQNLSSTSISNALDFVRETPEDILLFYFSGHGFHDEKNTTPWPSLVLSPTHEAISSSFICQYLHDCQARLTIILFDCCNSYSTKAVGIKKMLPSQIPSISVLQKLFLKTFGTIIATASIPGSPSYAFQQGSLFTSTFVHNLLFSQENQIYDWSIIFENITTYCSEYQVPYVELHVDAEQVLRSR